MARRGSGCLTALALVLSIAFVALAATLFMLVANGGGPGSPEDEGSPERVAADSFDEYSWQELSDIAGLIAAAPSDEEGRAVASQHGIEVGDTRTLTLGDASVVELRVVGIRADERADGGGVAGLTLMTSPIAVRPFSDEKNEGGWESSDLRSWLAGEGASLLPDELVSRVVPVLKVTDNAAVRYGDSGAVEALTTTADALWVPSVSEVCGEVDWFAQEYGTTPSASSEYVDFRPYDEALSAQGEQYEYFSDAGVDGSGTSGALVMAYGGTACNWWYRTSYPYALEGWEQRMVYQVMSSGYPGMTSGPSEQAGVVVGLCL